MGGVHGVYQIIGKELKPIKEKINNRLNTKIHSFSYSLVQIFINFILVSIAWIFFRSSTVSDAINYIGKLFTKWDFWNLLNNDIYNYGIDKNEFVWLILAIIILIIIDIIKHKKQKNIYQILDEQCIWFRWCVYVSLIVYIILFGVYGPNVDSSQFIYFQF